MKKYFMLAVILAAGMVVYPQTTRSARETKKITVRSESQAVKRIETNAAGRTVNENKAVRLTSLKPVGYDAHDKFHRSDDFKRAYNDYNYWSDSRVIRYTSHNPRYRPMPADYRREHYVYRQPDYYDLNWTPDLYNRFKYYYPVNNYWDIEYGREIETISAYDVNNYIGKVKRVYGKVDEVYFSREDYNYILYIGAPFPYQDISIVIPRNIARQVTRTPERYFKNQHIWVIGLIELWEGMPEIVIRDEEQVQRY